MQHVEQRRGPRRPLSYYGVPPVHKPHWKWLIVSYFFLGGLSAGSYVVASMAELFGHRDDRDTVRVGRLLAALAIIPCPILLALDLGRPERFLNMFRVLKLRSPMSLGTWGLLGYGGFASLSLATQLGQEGRLGGPGRLLRSAPNRLVGVVGSWFGFFVGGYTGVLLGATAVPLWARNARLLGPLFLSSALAAGCAAISLVLALLPGRREAAIARLRRAETVAALGELLLGAALHLNSGRLAAPLTEGGLGRLHLSGSVAIGIVGPLLLHAIGPMLGMSYRVISVLAGLASLAGGFILKYAIVMAGHASADDPAATFEFAGGGLPEGMAPTPGAEGGRS